MIKEISKFLTENTDEIIALGVVLPGMTVMSYLVATAVIQPEIILIPISMILVHYFRKSEVK